MEEVSEILILEQYLRMLSPELQVWVREKDPRTAAEAASLADVFVAARERISRGLGNLAMIVVPLKCLTFSKGRWRELVSLTWGNLQQPDSILLPNDLPYVIFVGKKGTLSRIVQRYPLRLHSYVWCQGGT